MIFLISRRLLLFHGQRSSRLLEKMCSVSQPGHWRSISLLTPGDAQSDSRIFFNYLSPTEKKKHTSLSLMTRRHALAHISRVLWMNVTHLHSPVAAGSAGATNNQTESVVAEGEGFVCVFFLFFLPALLYLPLLFFSFYLLGTEPVCLHSAVLSVCLSNCLSDCLIIKWPVFPDSPLGKQWPLLPSH